MALRQSGLLGGAGIRTDAFGFHSGLSSALGAVLRLPALRGHAGPRYGDDAAVLEL